MTSWWQHIGEQTLDLEPTAACVHGLSEEMEARVRQLGRRTENRIWGDYFGLYGEVRKTQESVTLNALQMSSATLVVAVAVRQMTRSAWISSTKRATAVKLANGSSGMRWQFPAFQVVGSEGMTPLP